MHAGEHRQARDQREQQDVCGTALFKSNHFPYSWPVSKPTEQQTQRRLGHSHPATEGPLHCEHKGFWDCDTLQ
ncbi:hypothetical protein SKAU_G00040180 [Synaphobranchus kaupii]|uniref:Uncharacterized protein n=1 Tax=Synaphobranchus kaupii TaxID=118154 RepID=A0A9Q1G1T8_SYNKA|nr:hypothetical protein SKAU_G00040180 [Synaphobranchus kaupii]